MANRRQFTAKQFIDAIPGTGGIISALADKVGCGWHTAKRYLEDYVTVAEAWEAERNKITDKAKHNIIKSIQGGDLQMSKWWLQVIDPDFMPTQKIDQKTEHSGEIDIVFGEPIPKRIADED
jgi:hypothetical protein